MAEGSKYQTSAMQTRERGRCSPKPIPEPFGPTSADDVGPVEPTARTEKVDIEEIGAKANEGHAR